jgi:TP901 family phage tail tape measure protein
MATALGEMTVAFKGETSGLSGAVGQATNIIRGFGGSAPGLLGFVGTALAGVAVAAIGIGVASVKMAADYQQSMKMVQALTGATSQQMAQYDEGLKKLALDAGVAPLELSKGLYYVISAGYSGAQALQVLTLSTEDAKISMTSQAVTANALTTVLKAFGVQAGDIVRVNGEMLETVTLGKMTMVDYAGSIGKASSTAMQFHVSMENMNASIATMTANGIPSAHQAVTDFNQVVGVMYGNIGAVTASLHKNKIAFDEAKFNTLDYADKIHMLNDALQIASDKHVHITGVTKQAAAALQILSQHSAEFTHNLQLLSDKQAMAKKTADAWAITQSGFNQQMDRAKEAVGEVMMSIGNALLPVLSKLVAQVTPVITKFAEWLTSTHVIENAVNAFSANLQKLGGFLSSLPWGTIIAGIMQFNNALVQARQKVDWMGPAMQAAWNVISKVDWAGVFGMLGHMIQQVSGFVTAQFLPVWKELQKSFADMQAALKPIMPQLQEVAGVLGGVLVAAIVIAIAVIGGLIEGLAGAIGGLIQFFTGFVQIISGTIEVISGIISFFVDLCTGHFNRLGADLSRIMSGIGETFLGAWNVIAGVWNFFFGLINGFTKGFVTTILGLFQDFSDRLVGHSIIPNMINSVVAWFLQLPGRVAAAVRTMVSTALGILSNFVGQAIQSGANIVQGIATGITNGIGAVASAIGNVASFIASHLPQSPAKVGPLRNLEYSGAQITKQIGDGMLSALPKLQTAMVVLLHPVVSAPASITAPSPATYAPVVQSQQGQPQVIQFIVDGKVMAQVVGNSMMREIQVKQGVRHAA